MLLTIKEVAKKANVSTATVSRVLNNNYPVSEKLRLKVLEAVRELNYQPNDIARSLKTKKTHMIGIVVSDITNPYFMQIAKGVESIVISKGYNLVFCSTNENSSREIELLRLLNEKRVDAIILATCQKDGSYIKQLIGQGLPVILVDRKISGCENVDTIIGDDFSASYNIVNYLISRGHKKISILNGLLNISTGEERFKGFKKALEDNDIPIVEKYILKGHFQRDYAYRAVKTMIMEQKSDLPTAIFAANNFMAEGAMIAIYEQGLSIPENISLVSFGNLTVPQLVKPRLTVVSQNPYVIGQESGKLVLERINGKRDNYRKFVMSLKMQEGDSVNSI
jgi:LacI family transcriptional regulator